jgi:sulfite exporter TauE/SafE
MHTHGVAGQLDLIGFAVLGLLGGVGHCVGMCAPFVLLVSKSYGRPRRSPALAQLWYGAGRISTYALLGAAAGALGGVVELAGRLMGVQRLAAGAAGIALIVTAVLSLTDRGAAHPLHAGWFNRAMARIRSRFPGHPFVLGLFLGLLPCGLLYTAVLAAVARGGASAGAVALAAFGAGTLPSLFGVAIANEFLLRRPWLNRVAQVFVLVMGAWYVWRGLAA